MKNNMENNSVTDEQFKEAMDSWSKYEDEIIEHNKKILTDLNVDIDSEDFEEVIEGCNVTGKIEIVDKPSGENQHEGRGSFKETWVDQWSTGDSGDSWAGFIYVKHKDKWIKIPYDC